MRNRTMTDLQILSHLEQMEAARAEFNKWFDSIREKYRKQGFSEKEIIRYQIIAWNQFRRDKNL